MNWLLTKAITCVRQGTLYCSAFHFGPKTLVCKCLANAMLTLALYETIAKTPFVMHKSWIIWIRLLAKCTVLWDSPPRNWNPIVC